MIAENGNGLVRNDTISIIGYRTDMSNARKLLIVLSVIAFGVVGSLPFLRNSAPHHRLPQDSQDDALMWRERPNNVLLDIRSEPESHATGDTSRAPNRGNASDLSEQSNRRMLKGPVRLEKVRIVPELPADYRPLTDPASPPIHDNGQTRIDPGEELSEASPTAGNASEAISPILSVAKRYTIVDGDTLPDLAERFLGDRNRDEEIFQANQAVLASPNSLPIGVEIVIPAGK